jgi:hypothetical protein
MRKKWEEKIFFRHNCGENEKMRKKYDFLLGIWEFVS